MEVQLTRMTNHADKDLLWHMKSLTRYWTFLRWRSLFLILFVSFDSCLGGPRCRNTFNLSHKYSPRAVGEQLARIRCVHYTYNFSFSVLSIRSNKGCENRNRELDIISTIKECTLHLFTVSLNDEKRMGKGQSSRELLVDLCFLLPSCRCSPVGWQWKWGLS